jgi:hypothetical protein
MEVIDGSNIYAHCIFSKFILDLRCLFCYQVVITENQKSFSHFITNVCAIIGGVFTVCIFYYLF